MGFARALITGIGGFAGQHLGRALRAKGIDVNGFTLAPEGNSEFHRVTDYGDIGDVDHLTGVMAANPPDVIYHLAGLAAVGDAWKQRRQVFEVNTLGTGACLEAAVAAAPKARVILVSSGLVYGHVAAADLPVTEDHPRRPRNPYAVSKACAEILASEFCASHDIELVIARPFNFAGPGQGLGFVSADFACQIARIEAGLATPRIRVGNLVAERDFTDVRDFVDGLVAAAERGVNGITYNLCTGRAVAIETVLTKLLAAATVAIEIEPDPQRLRPSETARFVGSNVLARRELGWQPRIPFEQTLADTLEWWRRRVREEQASDG